MKTITNNHTKNVLGKKSSINASTWNCRNKEACPLNGQCQIREVVYEGILSSKPTKVQRKKVLLNCGRIFQRTPIQPQFIFQK